MSTTYSPNRPPTHQHSKCNTLKTFATVAISAGAFASAALGLAGAANAAPSGPASVDQTISRLQARGYQVILNKVGSAPLSQCAISSVRPGQTYSRTDSGVPGAGDDLINTVTNKMVYVDVKC
jgi:hypothetical protein